MITKQDKIIVISLAVLAFLWLGFWAWMSNVSFCMNYKHDIKDEFQRFPWCAVHMDYLKEVGGK